MILYDLSNTEANPIYQKLAASNGDRQYSFLYSIVLSAIDTNQLFLSQAIIKALNFHAITCLHTNAGEYRPCEVHVANPDPTLIYRAPQHFRVSALMDNFTNLINRHFDETDAVLLGAHVLWKLCAIHPFINGNGRTARAACYYVICLKLGGWLPGEKILPSLLKEHPDYVLALKEADKSSADGALDLSGLCRVISECLSQQIQSATTPESS